MRERIRSRLLPLMPRHSRAVRTLLVALWGPVAGAAWWWSMANAEDIL